MPVTTPKSAATATLLLASTLTVMAGATISPALPKLETHFAAIAHAKLLVELLLTIPAAAIAATAIIAGRLVRSFGGRDVLFISVVIYAAAGTTGLWLNSLWALLAGRILLGIAVAGIMTSATSLIGDLFRGDDRSRLLGWQAAATAGGGLVFLLGGGALADLSWRGPFAIYFISLTLLPGILVALPGGRQVTVKNGEPGRAGKTSRTTLLAAALIFVMGASFYLVPTKLPFRLIEIGTTGGLWSGAAIGVTVTASGLASLIAGRLAAAIGRPWAFALGFMLLGAGLAGIGLGTTYATLPISLFVVGLGTGIAQPTLMAYALDASSSDANAQTSGLMTAAMFSGQFVSPLIASPIEQAASLGMAFIAIGAAASIIGLLAKIIVLRDRQPNGRARTT